MRNSTVSPGESDRAYADLETALREVGVRAAVVLGSVGKGERPLLVSGPLAELSDIEIACVGVKPWRKDRVTQAARLLSRRLGQNVRIYTTHPSWSTVRRFFSTVTAQVDSPTLKEYDCWFGSRIIFGRDFRNPNHVQPDRHPPSWEGVMLVLNHSVGVLRGMLLTDASPNRIQAFQEYAAAKVLLACTVFLELMLGSYHIDPRQRIEFLRLHAESWTRELAIDEGMAIRAFERALRAKSSPGNGGNQHRGSDVLEDTQTILDRVLRQALGLAQPPQTASLSQLATAYMRQVHVAPQNPSDLLVSKSIDFYRATGLLGRGKGVQMLRLAIEHRVAVRHLVYSQVGPLVLGRLRHVGKSELAELAVAAKGLYGEQRVASTREPWSCMALRVERLWRGFCE